MNRRSFLLGTVSAPVAVAAGKLPAAEVAEAAPVAAKEPLILTAGTFEESVFWVTWDGQTWRVIETEESIRRNTWSEW